MRDKSPEAIRAIAAEADHWKFFMEFCRYEKACGGPDPQFKLVHEMSRMMNATKAEEMWNALCYFSVYNVPTAEMIWTALPLSMHIDVSTLTWLRIIWPGIATRLERRSVRTPEKLFKYLDTARACLTRFLASPPQWMIDPAYYTAEERFDIAFDYFSNSIYSMGRYIGFKFIEYCARYLDMPVQLSDIRAKDGWSPRITLAILHPQDAERLAGDDSPPNIAAVNATADTLLEYMHSQGLTNLTHYELQTMLCEYRESYLGKRQYPGRSHDSELAYSRKIAPFWNDNAPMGYVTNLFEARKKLFPAVSLGELQTWNAARNDLGEVVSAHGYTWSDLIYDYEQSKHDLSKPVRRSGTHGIA